MLKKWFCLLRVVLVACQGCGRWPWGRWHFLGIWMQTATSINLISISYSSQFSIVLCCRNRFIEFYRYLYIDLDILTHLFRIDLNSWPVYSFPGNYGSVDQRDEHGRRDTSGRQEFCPQKWLESSFIHLHPTESTWFAKKHLLWVRAQWLVCLFISLRHSHIFFAPPLLIQ